MERVEQERRPTSAAKVILRSGPSRSRRTRAATPVLAHKQSAIYHEHLLQLIAFANIGASAEECLRLARLSADVETGGGGSGHEEDKRRKIEKEEQYRETDDTWETNHIRHREDS